MEDDNTFQSGLTSSKSMLLTDALPPTVHHSISYKLTSSNFVLWKAQFIPVLHAYNPMGLVDGAIKPPSQFITDSDGAEVLNDDFVSWRRKDQLV
jgi:hypothetical protein